jgi:hypothetical protein
MEEEGSQNGINKNKIIEKKRTRGPTKRTKFPLPPSHTSFDYHLKVLKGLNIVSKKGSIFVTYKEVAPISNVSEDTVSKVLKFYFDMGILERDKGGSYKPKDELIVFLNKMEWDDSGVLFGKILIKTWIGEFILQLFEMEKEVNSNDLVKNFGRYSEADKSNIAELKIIIKLLIYGQIIEFEDKSKNYHLSPIYEKNRSSELIKSEPKKDETEQNEMGGEISLTLSEKTSQNETLKPERNTGDIPLFEKYFESDTQNVSPFYPLSIQLMVSLNEDSDVEKIALKIKNLKRLMNNN